MKPLLEKLPQSSTKRTVQSGQLWQLGNHRLLCGDATNTENANLLCGKEKIDLLFTDPPYGVAVVEGKQDFTGQKKHKIIANDHLQSGSEYKHFSWAWLKPLSPYFSKTNSFYIFNTDRMIFSLRDALTELGMHISQLLLWVKNNSVMSRLDYNPQHELILYGWKGKHAFRKSSDRSVLFCPRPQKSTLHPTMKPISLLRRLILNSSERGQIVCDPFGGSGSTLLACEQTHRKCLMMELDPEYCAIIIARWEALSQEKAVPLK